MFTTICFHFLKNVKYMNKCKLQKTNRGAKLHIFCEAFALTALIIA